MIPIIIQNKCPRPFILDGVGSKNSENMFQTRGGMKHPVVAPCKKVASPAGFEPARAEPIRFLIERLNHSAIVTCEYSGGQLFLIGPE